MFELAALELEDEAFDEALLDAPVVVPQPATSAVSVPIASIDTIVRLTCGFKILPPLLA